MGNEVFCQLFEKNSFQGFKKILSQANAGTRAYFVPDSLYSKDTLAYLKEEATDGITKGDVQTPFVKKKRKFRFVSYHPNRSFFTWNDNSKYAVRTKNPIICLSTAANMNYIDIGNLLAIGFDGSLRFENKTAKKKAPTFDRLAAHSLSDNAMAFASVQGYIDGLQKSLWKTVTLFSTVIALFLIVLVFMLLVIFSIYQLANQERIAVKRFFRILKTATLPFAVYRNFNKLCFGNGHCPLCQKQNRNLLNFYQLCPSDAYFLGICKQKKLMRGKNECNNS